MLGNILDSLERAGLDIHGIEIYCSGQTCHKLFGEDVRRPVYSVTKSLTAAAFCLAAEDGLAEEDMPLYDLLDRDCRALAGDSFRTLPFSRFLTMTAGKYPFRPSGDHWLREILGMDIDHADTGFHYSNIPAYLVGAALENAVGGDLMGYLDRRLFTPLGIPRPTCARSPEGHFYGATGMELTVHERALLGRLFLLNGEWEGKPLISGKTVSRALMPRVDTGSGDRYGWFFRIAGDHFSMVGKWGQRCVVFPERELVIAWLSHQPERSDELYRTVIQSI